MAINKHLFYLFIAPCPYPLSLVSVLACYDLLTGTQAWDVNQTCIRIVSSRDFISTLKSGILTFFLLLNSTFKTYWEIKLNIFPLTEFKKGEMLSGIAQLSWKVFLKCSENFCVDCAYAEKISAYKWKTVRKHLDLSQHAQAKSDITMSLTPHQNLFLRRVSQRVKKLEIHGFTSNFIFIILHWMYSITI